MNDKNLAYCSECEDLVEFTEKEEVIEETYKGESVKFIFKVGRCKECGHEVAIDLDYNTRRSLEKIEAYKKLKGIILEQEIVEILEKYDVGKEALADIAGFSKATIKRYFEGYIPARQYSDTLHDFLNNEEKFYNKVEENKYKLKENAYRKLMVRYFALKEISDSKINQVANYIITRLGEVTPLALEKLLGFSNGVNYALNGEKLLSEECQAWQHGYVYPEIYNKYKKYKFKPIDCGIKSTHGCMLSKLSQDEMQAIDLVIKTFGIYSPKTLELISHSQDPWIEKRIGYRDDEPGNEVIDQLKAKGIRTTVVTHKGQLTYTWDDKTESYLGGEESILLEDEYKDLTEKTDGKIIDLTTDFAAELNDYASEIIAKTAGTEVKDDYVGVTGVELGDDVSIPTDSVYNYPVTVKPVNATNKVIYWSVEDESIATINTELTSKTITTFKINPDAASKDLEGKDADAVKKVEEGLAAVKAAEDSEIIHFRHEGELPGKAEIKVKVGFDDTGDMGLYYYNPETGKFELVNAKVIVKDGYATFEIEHCSDYVLSKVDLTKTAETETKAAETVAGAEETKAETTTAAKDASIPKTGDNATPAAAALAAVMSAAAGAVAFSRKKNAR